jgi:uncharacterized membrane protein
MTALRHALLSYLFDSLILPATVNLIASQCRPLTAAVVVRGR